MGTNKQRPKRYAALPLIAVLVVLTFVSVFPYQPGYAAGSIDAPAPLLQKGHPVDWWFVFKFNSAAFPG